MRLSSENKKIVVVSDIHNDFYKTKRIISHEDADFNICLGDWFDSFYYDDNYDYEATAKYLLEDFLPKDYNITLFGNHDLHYLFNNSYTQCSGFEERKKGAIDFVLGKNKIYHKFKWYIWIDDFLCTHAGLHANFIDPSCKDNNDIDKFLEKEVELANINLVADKMHWFYAPGFSRGGSYKQGGIVWLDFNQEFQPVEGLNQIFGHTTRRKGSCEYRNDESKNSINLCIDCFQSEYLVIENKEIKIKKYIDL